MKFKVLKMREMVLSIFFWMVRGRFRAHRLAW